MRGTNQWLRNAVVDVRVRVGGAMSVRSLATARPISPEPAAMASYSSRPGSVT